MALTVALPLAAWGANRHRHSPWQHPDRLRDLALVWGAVGGTSFYDLNLDQVNFAGASLANTDLRGRSLYRTCFRQAQRLERARTDNRYLDLDNPKVQALLTHGTSADRDFRGLNLQGINLRRTADFPPADLQEIDFSGANLMGADLRGANLTGSSLAQANLVNADLSEATLTDTCIEDWHLSPSTRFQGVICQRVFLRRSPKGHFLDPQPERGEFQPGEFEVWVAAIQRSVSLSFQEAVNPQALAFALTQTALNYRAPDLFSVQTIHQQEQGSTAQIDIASEKLLQLDKDEVHQELSTQYRAAVQRLESGYELTLQAKDSEIQYVRQLFATQQQTIERLTGQLAERSSPVMIQGAGNQIYMIQNAGGMTVNNSETNITAGGNVDMSSGTQISVGGDLSGSVDMSSGAKVSIGGDVVGSSILSTLSGQVTTSIQQLRGVSVEGSQDLAAVLTTLQQAIDQDTALSEEQKKEALEAVETIAEEGKKPPEQRAAKLCAMAMNALKGVTATVSDVSKLATVLQSSAPVLLALLGL
nr:pentapeptide repeat-containing protein [Nodosilinea sp. TSF1-S3]